MNDFNIKIIQKNNEKVNTFNDILKQIKAHQDKTTFQVHFEAAIRRAKSNGICVIPSKGKTPKMKWKTGEDRLKAMQVNITDTIALFVLDFITLVDVDDPEILCKNYNINKEELEQVVNVRTRRGYHIFIADPLPTATLNKLTGMEVKRGDFLCVFPGSRYWNEQFKQNVFYEVLNTKVYTINDIPNDKLKQAILDTISDKIEANVITDTNNGDNIQESKNKDKQEIDLEKLRDLVLSVYTEGSRQNIVIYTTAFLLKNHVDVDVVKDFINEIITNDDERSMRLAGMEETIKKFKNNEEIKGYEGLVEYIPESELKKLFTKKDKGSDKDKKSKEKKEFLKFVIENNILYAVFNIGEETFMDMIGPGIKFEYILYNVEESKRQIFWSFDKFTYTDIKFEKDYIETYTKIPVTNGNLFKKYIANEVQRLEKEKKYKYIMNRTGWFSDNLNDNVFCLPQITHDNIIYEHPEIDRFITDKKDEQHNFVTTHLELGNELGFLFVCAVASILLKHLNIRGFTVTVTGPANVGKTTVCKLACNLFYDCRQEIDLYATHTAKERILISFKDLPFLLNEAATTKDDFIQSVIMMMESGQGKKRSTPKLNYYYNLIRNVLLLTSEREIKLDRLGAERRKLVLNLSERVNFVDPKKHLKMFGAGIDYIHFLINKKDEIFKYIDEDEKKCKQYYELPILTALRLFESYYNKKFNNMRKKILDIFSEQKNVDDYYEHVVSCLESFVNNNIKNFYCPELNFKTIITQGITQKIPNIPGQIYGLLNKNDDEYWTIIILPYVFDNFCNDYNLDKTSVLKLLENENLLVTNDTKKTFKLYKKNLPVELPASRAYKILLPINIQENITHTDEEDEEEINIMRFLDEHDIVKEL